MTAWIIATGGILIATGVVVDHLVWWLHRRRVWRRLLFWTRRKVWRQRHYDRRLQQVEQSYSLPAAEQRQEHPW